MIPETKRTSYIRQWDLAKVFSRRMSSKPSHDDEKPSHDGDEILKLKQQISELKSEIDETRNDALSREKKLAILLHVNEQNYRQLELELANNKRAQLVAERKLMHAQLDKCLYQNNAKVNARTEQGSSQKVSKSISADLQAEVPQNDIDFEPVECRYANSLKEFAKTRDTNQNQNLFQSTKARKVTAVPRKKTDDREARKASLFKNDLEKKLAAHNLHYRRSHHQHYRRYRRCQQ